MKFTVTQKLLPVVLSVVIVFMFVGSCKKSTDPYDKFDAQNMAGMHHWNGNYEEHYHSGSYHFDSTYSLDSTYALDSVTGFHDTTFKITVISNSRVSVGNTVLYFNDPYSDSAVIVFSSVPAGDKCDTDCHRINLYYNYTTRSIFIANGVYNVNGVDDRLYTYTAF